MGVAPVAPEAGLTVGLILLAIACVFLLALNKAWKFSVGALLSTLASAVSTLPHVRILGHDVPPWDALAGAIQDLDNYVLEAIGVGIQQTEKGLHAVIGAMTWLLQETAQQVAGLAADVVHAFHYVENVAIPAAYKATVKPVVTQVTHGEKHIQRIVTHPVEIVRPVTRILAPGLKALEAKVDALSKAVASTGVAALPGEITETITHPGAIAIPGLRDLTRGYDALWKRVKGLGRTLTPAGIVGLVAASVLSILGLGWLKCRNVGKAGKRICGLNSDILDGLLAGLFAVFGTIGLIVFAHDVQRVFEGHAKQVIAFWRADTKGPGGDRAIGQRGASG